MFTTGQCWENYLLEGEVETDHWKSCPQAGKQLTVFSLCELLIKIHVHIKKGDKA